MIGKLKKWLIAPGGLPIKRKRNSIYAGTKKGDLYGTWGSSNFTSNAELRSSLSDLRGRSRELYRNNDYARRLFKMIQRNVVGQTGFKLQMRIMAGKKSPDIAANQEIESAWRRWCEKGICEVTGKYSFIDVQNLAIKHVSMDGESLFRTIEGNINDFGFAVQGIESDHLDEKLNEINNNETIKLGIQIDKYGKPIKYHLLKSHPGDYMVGMENHIKRDVVDAREILHLYIPERISQNRGIPWIHAAMNRLNMLGGYEEAELVAARMGANVHGIWMHTDEEGGQFTGENAESEEPYLESEPGVDRIAPRGMKYELQNPAHPNNGFEHFIKAVLRGISSGMDVTYNYLANDYEGVNYSSLRGAEMETRDAWATIQQWFIDSFLKQIFPSWLKNAIRTGQVNLPMRNFDKYNKPVFMPRGFKWVDPKSEMLANTMKIALGITAPSLLAAEYSNLDYEELNQIIQNDRLIRETYKNPNMNDAELMEMMAKANAINVE